MCVALAGLCFVIYAQVYRFDFLNYDDQVYLSQNPRVNTGLSLANLEWEPTEEVPWKHGKIKLPALLRTHAYVNAAKMKTHIHTTVTLSTKNQKGLLLLRDKKEFHKGYGGAGDLHECIRELAEVVRPELTVADATYALEGTGPTVAPEGQTRARKLGICIGGTDVFEVDNACCRLMGIPVSEVRHLPEVPVELDLDNPQDAPRAP